MKRPPASISPSCAGSPTRTSLASARAGVVDQSRERRRVDHPRLVDQQDRPAGQLPPSAVKLGEQPRDAGRVEPLGAQDVGGAPGRRRDPEADASAGPASAAVTVAKVFPVPASPTTTTSCSPPRVRRSTIARWSALMVERVDEDAGDRDFGHHPWPSSAAICPGGGERVPLDLPDPLRGEARPLRASRPPRSPSRGRGRRRRRPRPRRLARRRGDGRRPPGSRRGGRSGCAPAVQRLLDGGDGDRLPVRLPPAIEGRGAIASRSSPISSAVERQRSRRLSSVRSRSLAFRVIQRRRLAGAGGGVGRRWRRGSPRAGSRRHGGGRVSKPSISAIPFSTSCQRTPSLRVSSWRRFAS